MDVKKIRSYSIIGFVFFVIGFFVRGIGIGPDAKLAKQLKDQITAASSTAGQIQTTSNGLQQSERGIQGTVKGLAGSAGQITSINNGLRESDQQFKSELSESEQASKDLAGSIAGIEQLNKSFESTNFDSSSTIASSQQDLDKVIELYKLQNSKNTNP